MLAAHMDPECFRVALKIIEEFLSAEEVFFWAEINQHEKRCWSSAKDQAEGDISSGEIFPGFFHLTKNGKGVVCYHIYSQLPISSQEKKMLLEKGVNNLMIIPIRWINGTAFGILGAINMKRHWKTTAPLDWVSLSFVMTIEQYASYRRLTYMGQTDIMTGLLNRNSYDAALKKLEGKELRSVSCVYIDVNGLHDVNNRFGHQFGDEMLVRIAEVLKNCFPEDSVYRIGGDEFVVLCMEHRKKNVYEWAEIARRAVKEWGYEISVGIQYQERERNISHLVNEAEAAMRADKQQYYEESGGEKHSRILDKMATSLARQKQDMDMFLSVLAPMFKGVYFVDLQQDTVRHIFIPSYFTEILRKEGGSFARGLHRYARELVKKEFCGKLEQFCQVDYMEKRLRGETMPELKYQKLDGSWIHLYVMKTRHNTESCRETLWIFMDVNRSLDIEKMCIRDRRRARSFSCS